MIYKVLKSIKSKCMLSLEVNTLNYLLPKPKHGKNCGNYHEACF